ncbi:MAG: hypothetical protein AAF921_07720 [Cyanobacteria bacterium P01_D01_bin.44]
MNTLELIENLTQKGVTFLVSENTLNIRAPKGIVTPEIRTMLTRHKPAILTLLQEKPLTHPHEKPGTCQQPYHALSLTTLGRLIGGGHRSPTIDPTAMAQALVVAFRPLPPGYKNETIRQFRAELQAKLEGYGVRVEPWGQATKPFHYSLKIPPFNWKIHLKTNVVRSRINAVIDVERPASVRRTAENWFAEKIYQLYVRFFHKGNRTSIPRIVGLIGWAEDHVAKYIENPTDTQVITLTEVDREFINPDLHYRDKITLGLNTLIRTFSELVIGVSEDCISILNMNLSDSKFARDEIDRFVLKSLIPKVFVPIAPLLIDQFEVGDYNPRGSKFADQLVSLGRELASTGLLPPGFKLSQVIQRQSHRDIVDIVVNGRTGVSYGFIAYIEPPIYVGEPEITGAEWASLQPIDFLSDLEVRQNAAGRRYVRLQTTAGENFKQIPDIWLVSSRSGSNKTDLKCDRDVLRVGLKQGLLLQLPQDTAAIATDIKPSYDIYVMVAIALAAAIYTPDLVKQGAPIVHFHGYPSANWFQSGEHFIGVDNPSVPCGTYESGVFNFLGISRLAEQNPSEISLISLIEPDHGTNIIAANPQYLIDRLKQGCHQGHIELGGKHFASLRSAWTAKNPSETTPVVSAS